MAEARREELRKQCISLQKAKNYSGHRHFSMAKKDSTGDVATQSKPKI